MNPAHIHLLLNHFPIIGTLIGGIILLVGLFTRNRQLQSTGSFILFLMALAAIPVYLTGEPAEEAVEKIPGISEAAMEMHEEAAAIALWVMLATGLLAMLAWFLNRTGSRHTPRFFVVTGILFVFSFAAMARTGYLGGQIRHTELHSGVTAGQQKPALQQEAGDDD